MEAAQMEALTSGASGRIIPVFRNLRSAIPSYQSLKQCLILFYSTFICFLLLLLPLLPRPASSSSSSASSITPPPSPKSSSLKRRSVRFRVWRDEEDTMRRRALAETLQMAPDIGDGDSVIPLAVDAILRCLLGSGVMRFSAVPGFQKLI